MSKKKSNIGRSSRNARMKRRQKSNQTSQDGEIYNASERTQHHALQAENPITSKVFKKKLISQIEKK